MLVGNSSNKLVSYYYILDAYLKETIRLVIVYSSLLSFLSFSWRRGKERKLKLQRRRQRLRPLRGGPEAPPPEYQQQQQQRPSKKSKPSKAEDGSKESSKPAAAADVPDAVGSKTIIVEACKQCTQFKKRALLVKEGLENGVPGVIVKINPENPRRGCFEIREENGKTFFSLLAMPRPFEKMRALDMDKVIADIIKNIA